MKTKSEKKFFNELEIFIRAGIALVWVRTYEDDRFLRCCTKSLGDLTYKFYSWNASGLLQTLDEDRFVQKKFRMEETKTYKPTEVAKKFADMGNGHPSVLIVLDFRTFINVPEVIRSIKDNVAEYRKMGQTIIFISPTVSLPEELVKEIPVMDFPLPDKEELENVYEYVMESAKYTGSNFKGFSASTKKKLLSEMLGKTMQEVEDLISIYFIRNYKQEIKIIGKAKGKRK
jgi:hypothetical protein